MPKEKYYISLHYPDIHRILNLPNLALAEMKPVISLQLELVAPELCNLLLDVPGAGPELHEGLKGGLDAKDALQVAGVRQQPQCGHRRPLEVRESSLCPGQHQPQLFVVTGN